MDARHMDRVYTNAADTKPLMLTLVLVVYGLVGCGGAPVPIRIDLEADASPLEQKRIDAREAPPTQQWESVSTMPENELPVTTFCAYSGAFEGEWFGASAGTFACVVDARTGMVNGVGFMGRRPVLTIDGTQAMTNSNTMLVSAGSTSDNTIFQGAMRGTDAIHGTWLNPIIGGGEFESERTGAMGRAKTRLTARFSGADRGWIAIDVSEAGRLTGTLYSHGRKTTVALQGTWEGNIMRLRLADNNVITARLTDIAAGGELRGSWQAEDQSSGTFQGSGCRLEQ